MIGYTKKNREIIRESALDKKIKEPGLKFNLGLVLTGIRTTGPWSLTTFNIIHFIIFQAMTQKPSRITVVHDTSAVRLKEISTWMLLLVLSSSLFFAFLGQSVNNIFIIFYLNRERLFQKRKQTQQYQKHNNNNNTLFKYSDTEYLKRRTMRLSLFRSPH